ncbi:acetyltransferase [Paenibacillus daejeonensis]|uniref:acetyltransferase n=1 Tax=Paenibacillus daejeonensis TaxID=135193 RepID=UPI0003603584|nr:acetyltransferase [Paenibacillus daejeonensis]
MNIQVKPYESTWHEQLVEIWERAVRATHHFLSEDDIVFYRTAVRDQALTSYEVRVAVNEESHPVGFIGTEGSHVEMLFVDPLVHGQGVGRELIQDAMKQAGPDLSVDVNEQNEQAALFYQRLGFHQVGRSELDSSGRPFPILHLKFINGSE